MPPEKPWLSADQQRVWRSWLALSTHLPAVLNRQLHDDSGLSLSDFDVLVQLTEAPAQRVRVSDLATALSWERSRLSHHVKRMQGRGLVDRVDCEDDGRGAFVVLTPVGLAAIGQAAPGHAETVRAVVFDALSADELSSFGQVLDGVLTRLGAGRPS